VKRILAAAPIRGGTKSYLFTGFGSALNGRIAFVISLELARSVGYRHNADRVRDKYNRAVTSGAITYSDGWARSAEKVYAPSNFNHCAIPPMRRSRPMLHNAEPVRY